MSFAFNTHDLAREPVWIVGVFYRVPSIVPPMH